MEPWFPSAPAADCIYVWIDLTEEDKLKFKDYAATMILKWMCDPTSPLYEAEHQPMGPEDIKDLMEALIEQLTDGAGLKQIQRVLGTYLMPPPGPAGQDAPVSVSQLMTSIGQLTDELGHWLADAATRMGADLSGATEVN